MKPSTRRRRASAAVEFALILPVWFALVSGIMEFAWLFYNHAVLDASASVGCRAGSLIDPGERDQHIGAVEVVSTDRMVELLAAVGGGDCDDCDVRAYTVGAPPLRSLVCEAHRTVEPLLGLYVAPVTLRSRQIARLEWQREGVGGDDGT